MAKAKALKEFTKFAKTQKKKEKVLNEFMYGKKGAREIEKGAKAIGKKRKAKVKAEQKVPKMVKDALKKEVRSMRKAERRKLIKATLDDIFSGKQSKLNPFTKKHSGGVVRKQAGGFVHRRNQRRQG